MAAYTPSPVDVAGATDVAVAHVEKKPTYTPPLGGGGRGGRGGGRGR